MAKYFKPQKPLQNYQGDFIYPLTFSDQVIMEDGQTRLSGQLSKFYTKEEIHELLKSYSPDSGEQPSSGVSIEYVNNQDENYLRKSQIYADASAEQIKMDFEDTVRQINTSLEKKLDESSIINNLTSSSTVHSLSAAQGQVLKKSLDEKLDEKTVVNNLTSNFTTKPLSAAQGQILKNSLDEQNVRVSSLETSNGRNEQAIAINSQNINRLSSLEEKVMYTSDFKGSAIGTVKNSDKIENKNLSDLVNYFLPIGTIISNISASWNPNNVYPGTKWQLIEAGRSLRQSGGSHTLNSKAGEEKHTLTVSELPPHRHSIVLECGQVNSYGRHDVLRRSTLLWDDKWEERYTIVANAGGNQAFNVLGPSLYVNLWQRTA